MIAGVTLSTIDDTMSLQFQANPSALKNEAKADKEKADNIGIRKEVDKVIGDFLHSDITSDKHPIANSLSSPPSQNDDNNTAIKQHTEKTRTEFSISAVAGDFLHAETRSGEQEITDVATAMATQAVTDAAAEKASGTLEKMQQMFEEVMGKPISDKNPESAGSALKNLAESLQQSLDSMKSLEDVGFKDDHAKVSIGGGFVVDLISGEISFNIATLLKERSSEESTNEFIKSLKDSGSDKAFPTFQDVLADIGKVPTELNPQKDHFKEKEEAWVALNEVMSKPSMIETAHKEINSEKALGLLY